MSIPEGGDSHPAATQAGDAKRRWTTRPEEWIFIPMERWPQRTRFRQLIEKYKATHRIVTRDVAELLNLKASTLLQYMYNRATRPSEHVLHRAAILFECSILEFLEDPAASRARTQAPESEDSSGFFSNLILKDLKAEDLTDEDRRILFEDFQQGLARLRALKGQGSAGGSHTA